MPLLGFVNRSNTMAEQIPPGVLLAHLVGTTPAVYLSNWFSGFGTAMRTVSLRLDGTWDVTGLQTVNLFLRFPFGLNVEPDH